MKLCDLLQEQADSLRAGRDHAVVTIIEAENLARTSGKMIVYADGSISGTVGGGMWEQVAREDALKALENGKNMVKTYTFAEEFAHLFSTVTHKFMAISDAHMQMSAVATSQPKDVLVLFSYSGATTSGVDIMELAKSRNLSTIVVTRYPKSPAAEMADVVLRCGSNEGPFQFGSVPAKIAQLVVMDVLFQEYCHRNRQRCEDNIQRIAAALSDQHL